jgi:hypothetical protein
LAASVVVVGGLWVAPTPAQAADLVFVVRDGVAVVYQRVPRAVVPVTGAGRTVSDFDGDGVDDITSGAHAHPIDPSTRYGSGVVVRYSSLPATDYLFATPVGPHFFALGDALVTGNFNGDGFDDLVVTAAYEAVPDTDVQSGAVWVVPGSADGLQFDRAQHITQATAGVPGSNEHLDRFGAAAAAGDLNGDGHDDLAVGAPGESIGSKENAGAVTVLLGGPGGLTTDGVTSLHQDLDTVPGAAEADDRFGDSVAVGSVNGDTRDDLVIGVPNENGYPDRIGSGTGMVALLPGAPGGVAATGATTVTGDAATKAFGSDRIRLFSFGMEVAVTDANGDGRGDVIVGAPMAQVDSDLAGVVASLVGRTDGLRAAGVRVVSQDTPGVPGAAEHLDYFGAELSVGDVDGDRRGDVLVGVPGEDIGSNMDAGAVTLLFGSAVGLTGTDAQGLDQNSAGVPGTAEVDDGFGSATALLNLDGVGGVDAVVGAPHETVATDEWTGSLTTFHEEAGRLAPVAAWSGRTVATEDFLISDYGSRVAGARAS